MDAELKKDIQNHFRAEYFQAARAEKKGILKFIDKMNDKFDAFAGKLGFNAPGLGILSALVVSVVSPPTALAMIGAWVVNYTEQLVVSLQDHAKASKAVSRDIDNGELPERYNDVIDSKIDGLKGKIELYTAQKTQLPPKGEATAAFAAAVEGAANENAAPAPAPQPQAAPKL